jgi:hypothetical protein
MLVCLAGWRFLLGDERPAEAATAAGARSETASPLGAITP